MPGTGPCPEPGAQVHVDTYPRLHPKAWGAETGITNRMTCTCFGTTGRRFRTLAGPLTGAYDGSATGPYDPLSERDRVICTYGKTP